MNLEQVIGFLIPFISQNSYAVAFFGGLLAGEEVVMALAFMVANDILPLWVVFVFSFVGVLVCDSFFFLVGKLRIVRSLNRFEKIAHIYGKLDSFIIKFSRDSIFRTLLYTKFIFGTRLLTLVILGFRNIKFSEFLKADLFVVLVWSIVVVGLGWFAGSSFKIIVNVFKSVQIALFFIILLAFLVYIGKKWAEKRLIKELKK